MPTIEIREVIEVPAPPEVEHPPRIVPVPPPIQLPEFNLPASDGIPMDTPWHQWAMILLIESVHWHLRGRTDFYAGGNMFIYYGHEQARTWKYRGPDFFFVNGVDGTRPRRYWLVFEEGGRYPNVIVELLSPSTEDEDRTTKKAIYEQTFRTPEYFLYDPKTQRIDGWRHDGNKYQPVAADARGWLWSEQLQLWLGTWEGIYQRIQATWPRFYDREGNLILIAEEAGQQQAEAERQQAERERQHAQAERERADALADELARLKALLAEKNGPGTNP